MQSMKTLIEIYDNEQILNLITAYNEKPEKVIFLYDKAQEEFINNKVIEKYVGNHVEYVLYSTDEIERIISENKDIAFDVHGGNNFAIAQISQLAMKYDTELYYPDLENKKMIVLKDGNHTEKDIEIPKLKVKEIIALYGGSVRNLPEVIFDDDGRKAVETCMAIKHKNNKRWVSFCKLMGGLNKKYYGSDAWFIEENTYRLYRGIFEELNCIFNICDERNKKKITFKNKDYEVLVTDTGVPFEYDTYYQIVDSEYFDDVDIRVNIDWNGEPFNKEDPNSELDVIATKDGRLISISCKSGKYDQQAVYEVKANATKFGGNTAISVLCADLNVRHPELVKKAEEIGVLLVEHKTMWDKQFVSVLKKWMDTH